MDHSFEQLADQGGELSRLIAAFDWGRTSLGPMACWPAHVKTTVGLLVRSTLPIVTLWGRDGVLIYNDAYAGFAGGRHPDLLGAKVLEGWPEVAGLNARVLEAGFAGRTLSFRDESIVLHRHGFPETIWVDLDYSPIPDAFGQPAGVLAVVRETTERVRLERQRGESLRQLNALESRQRYLVELGDRLRKAETEAEIARAVAAIVGKALGCLRAGYAVVSGHHTYIQNDWTDGSVRSLTGQHEFTALGPGYITLIRRGEVLVVPDIDSHAATRDSAASWRAIDVGAVLNVPLMENGELVGLIYAHAGTPRAWTGDEVSLVEDMADRTWEAIGRARATQALRRMNETLEAQVRERTAQRDRMWTLSTDIMMMTNTNGKILSVNPAWTTLLGWREDELVGSSFYEFIHPDDIEMTRVERRKLEAGKMVHHFENRYRTKAGGAVWLSWKAVPDGGIVHSVARDITAEREQAEALQAAEEALRHAQKMEAVGQLTGGIAHDFNNLLQGILGSLALVEKRIEQGRPEGLAEYAAHARASAERAGALTHRLLAFSRRQPLDPKPVQANPLIVAMEPLLRRTLGEMIVLNFQLAEDLWPTLCDPHQLDSAILNLAINARDAMPDGGMLTIRSYNAGAASQNTPPPGGLAGGDYICLAVTDTGTGMPPDVVERAFDPFYTTKPIGQGTGLGLSMVYGFMRQSGGHARIASTVGRGTTLSLFLPRHEGADIYETGPDAAPPAAQAAPGQGAVLVMEDEPVVRSIVVEVLEDLGYQTIEAADGPAGLEILQSNRPIDLLVTDIGLPGLNGRQVADAARLTRPRLKILFMTGYAETASMADGFLATGMQMITKPFAIDSLAARIKAIIETDWDAL
jgi:PAS domain S-box-containing protein